MEYQEALAYFHEVSWMGSRPGLERIQRLCALLGHPERALRCIHVAGTNGKGSFCCMLAAILQAAGYSTGCYTSPYVEKFNERIQINGENVSDTVLCRAVEAVKACTDRMQDDPPTEFERITAAAFYIYKECGCDYVVLETGLGGRLDATNCITEPILSVITGIDYDHMQVLGNTLTEIAGEKAGIIKPNRPVLFGEGAEEAETVIRERAAALQATYRRTDYTKIQNVRLRLGETYFSYPGFPDICIHLSGVYQLHNAANVLTAVQMLRETQDGISIPQEAVYRGMASARWKARFEILSENPLAVYDGAHNPQGVAAACSNIRQYLQPLHPSGKVILCMGVLRDKDYLTMIAALAPYTAEVFTITPENPRALSAVETAAAFRENGIHATPANTIKNGVLMALERAHRGGEPLFVLGSLYIYGQVKEALQSARRLDLPQEEVR